MNISGTLIERIRGISVCGGATSCPAALREEAVAAIASEAGLHLQDHAARSMLAEILEQYILDLAASGAMPASQGPKGFLDESNIQGLLEMNGMEMPSDEALTALTVEAEEWTRQRARQILEFAGTDTPTAEAIKAAILHGLEA